MTLIGPKGADPRRPAGWSRGPHGAGSGYISFEVYAFSDSYKGAEPTSDRRFISMCSQHIYFMQGQSCRTQKELFENLSVWPSQWRYKA